MGVLKLCFRLLEDASLFKPATGLHYSTAGPISVFATVLTLCFMLSGCGGTPAAINATASESDAAVSVAPKSVEFGRRPLGTRSQHFVRIANQGTQTITITGISVKGPFVLAMPKLPTSIPESSWLDVAVTFSPREERVYSGNLVVHYAVNSNIQLNPSGSPIVEPITFNYAQGTTSAGTSYVQIPLQGSGVTHLISVTPSSMTFGSQSLNTSSAPQLVTLTNTGNVNLQLQTLAVTGPFSVTGWPGSMSLPPAQSLALQVTFKPTVQGSNTGTLGVYSNAKSSPSMVALSGTGTTSSAIGISTASLPGGNVGVPYQASLQATGGTPGYSWSISSGSLPPGLTLAATTGQISGTSFSGGSSTFTASVADSGWPAQTTSRSFTINMAASSSLTITTSSLPSVTVGVPYNATLSAAGGVPPYTWSISSGGLPPGLALSPGGVISGTPTTQGTYSFGILVSDSAP